MVEAILSKERYQLVVFFIFVFVFLFVFFTAVRQNCLSFFSTKLVRLNENKIKGLSIRFE